ncbi:FAD-binding oxidoreductase [Actinoplanes sp. TBRC 11911]|uniref:FAD-binding oxidoreductase n=1 Tax=Actinoplanes sp. TBRC 11911 TaxID=2729386 RepID=UPI001B7D5591|nr:FAD-binding oxidoreductase [Actinoplanes sp. TBRC 11911]
MSPDNAAPFNRTDVPHMKWWGWGVDGVSFSYANMPAFAPFIKKVVGLDLETRVAGQAPSFDDLEVPPSRIDDDLVKALTEVAGADNVLTTAHERVLHTFGKSVRDLMRMRAGDFGRVPDVVVYPGSEAEVAAVVTMAAQRDFVVIPFGGGSNISGSLEPQAAEERVVVSLDMGRLHRLLDIDTDSGLARVEAGVRGPDLEAQLAETGWTLGHFPDSFTHSTLGGWVATRSSGMQSDKYGDIADITKGLRVARPDGILALRPLPSTSTGPSLREMILGSEGRLGVITEVTIQVHRKPEAREVRAYLFKTWEHGVAAMRAITQNGLPVTLTRVSDAVETSFSFATSKGSSGVEAMVKNGLMKYLKAKGWDLENIALSFVGYEGSSRQIGAIRKAVGRIVKANEGISIGTGPGALYDQKKFDTPYIRDFLLDRGSAADVSETAAPWSKLVTMHDEVVKAAHAALRQAGVQGAIMSHLSHSYRSGACLYFTFAFVEDGNPTIEKYDVVKRAIQQTFIEVGGTPSHHHAIGVEHAPWLEDVLSPSGYGVVAGLLESADPGRHLNPGKIVTTK